MEYLEGAPVQGPLPGLAEHRQALEEDPLCQTWHYTLSTTLSALGRNEEALAAIRKSVFPA